MFGSFGAGFGSFGSGVGGLFPSLTNLTSWLKTPTADGKTLANSKGADADLTDVNCLSFDGVDDYVVTEPITLGNNFELEWTGSLSGSEYFGRIIANKNSTNTEGVFELFRNADANSLRFVIYPNGGLRQESSYINFNFDGSVKTHKVTYNNGALTYVVDDVTLYSNTFSAGNGFTGSDAFGIYSRPNGTNNCGGILQNFKMSSGGVLHTQLPLAEGSGTTAYDVSGNGNHGTINGATWSTADGIESWNHEYGFSSAFANLDGADSKQLKFPITGLDQSTFDMTLWLEGTDKTASASKWFLDNGATFNFRGVEIKGTTANEILFITYFSGGRVLLRTPTVTDNQMYKFDVHFESGNSYLVIDGVKGTVDTTIFTPQFTGSEDNVYLFGKTDGGNAARGIIYKLNINGSEKVLTSAELIGSPTRYNFPALNTKTKQVATFDGVNDYVDTNTPNTSKGSYEVTFVPTLVNGTMIIAGGRPSTGRRTYIALDDQSVAPKLVAGIGDKPNNTFRGTTTIALGTRYGAKLTWDDATNNAELFLDQFDGNGFVSEATISYGSTASDADIFVGALNNSGTDFYYFNGEIHSFIFKDGSDNTVIEYDFQSDIGTTTVQDLSTNNNDGTATIGTADINTGAGGLAEFWGTRVADASGSLVSADYATGNTPISNPAGFVHNGSECGVKLRSRTVGTFDGEADRLDFTAHTTAVGDVFDLEFALVSNADYANGDHRCLLSDKATKYIALRDNDDGRIVVRGDSIQNATGTIKVADGMSKLKVTIDSASQVSVSINGGAAETLSTDFTGIALARLMGAGGNNIRYVNANVKSFSITNSSGAKVVDYDFKNDIGTTTVQDLTANNNDGDLTVGSGGTETFWADNYREYSATNLFSHTNGTNNTWVKKVGSNTTQIGQYDEDETLTSNEETLNDKYFG